MILFPVHEGENHWAAGCIEFEKRQVSYFNTIGQTKFEEFKSVSFLCQQNSLVEHLHIHILGR